MEILIHYPISVDQETLVYRRGGFSPPLSLLMPTFAFPAAPRPLTGPLQCRLECSPTSTYLYVIHSFGGMFDARLLSMPDRSTSELLRTL